MSQSYRIIFLPGDGVGPEVTESVRQVLGVLSQIHGFDVSSADHPIGGAAFDSNGSPLPPATLRACVEANAVFLGAVGGDQWNHLPTHLRPEAGLLGLRRELGVYCNLRPVKVDSALADGSPLKAERVAGTDLLIVRELTGGLYFGEPRGLEEDAAHNTLRYSRDEIRRIAVIAFDQARSRRGSVTSIDKANVLEVSVLWRRTVTDLQATEYPDVPVRHMYIDNAAMQFVLDPRQFDVVLTSNMFGDILSDLAATLPGSVGLLPSASIGGPVGLFEPVHGSAPDLVGNGQVNPIAAILSAAMMLDFLGEAKAASGTRRAVSRALADGFRTRDLVSGTERSVGTIEMTDAIKARLETN